MQEIDKRQKRASETGARGAVARFGMPVPLRGGLR